MWFLKMIWRELVALRTRTLFFVISVAIGVGAYTGLVCISDTVISALRSETRALLGGDVQVSSNRAFPRHVLETLQTWPDARTSHVIVTTSMARSDQQETPRLVEVMAVDGAYPLLGPLRTIPEGVVPGDGAIVDPSLAGERLVLGGGELAILGVLEAERSRELTSAFRGPRVLVALPTAERVGLLAENSRFQDTVLLLMPSGANLDAVKASLEDYLKGEGLESARVRTHEQRADSLDRRLQNVRSFVLIVGLAVLLLSSLAAAAGIGEFLRQRQVDVARLRCLGATPGEVSIILAGTIFAIVIMGILVGGGLIRVIWGGLPLAIPLLAPYFGAAPETFWHRLAEVSLAVSLTVGAFSLPQMLTARHQSPAGLLRDGESGISLRFISFLAWLPGLAAIPALFLIQAGQARFALAILGTGMALLVSFHVFSVLLLGGMRRLVERLPLFVRLALDELLARRGETTLTLAVIGFSLFLFLLVNGLRNDILSPLQESRESVSPNMFFIDVQPDQLAKFEDYLRKMNASPVIEAPLVRARLINRPQENDSTVPERSRERGGERRWLEREQNLTYRAGLGAGETVIAGSFWDEAVAQKWVDYGRAWSNYDASLAPPGETIDEVSLESRFAKRIGASVGDVVEFDVQGVSLRARVTSLREVVWQTWRPNFFIVMHPSMLAEAPRIHIVAAGLHSSTMRGAAVRGAQDNFPNVSAIDITEIVGSLLRIGSTIEGVINLLVGLLIVCTAFLLASSLLATRFLRDRHFAILRAIGMTDSALWKSLTIEFALLGILGAFLGGVASLAVLQWISQALLDLPETPRLWPALSGMLAMTILSVGLGLLLTHGSLRRKPLEVLRR